MADKFKAGDQAGRWALWFAGGSALGFFALCTATLLVIVLASAALNAYLAWEIAGLEFVVVRPMPTTTSEDSAAQNSNVIVLVTATPDASSTSLPTDTPISPTSSIAAAPSNTPEPTGTPQPTETPLPADTPTSVPATPSPAPTASADSASANTKQTDNVYMLIPIDGQRDSRPAAEHADLNLSLRNPQLSDVPAELVDYTGIDDESAPKLSAIFKPNIVSVYTAYEWDWACNCKTDLKDDGFLIGLKTTSGAPIFIPPSTQDIYQGKYYAMVLYASEDSLTFTYGRSGTVAQSYVVHYQGLMVDPNLLALYQESVGNELPGLTLETPVGVATEELIISVRDHGTFMDTRSRKDWWD